MQTVIARTVTLRALHGSCEEASFRARASGAVSASLTSLTSTPHAAPYAVRPMWSIPAPVFPPHIWEEPYNGTVQKYRRLGLSRRQGQKIRHGLIQKGLIKKIPCQVPEGMIVLMEVSSKGRQVLETMGVDTSKYNPREGGAVHRYWVERMAKEFTEKGYRVEKEVSVGDSIIDLVATAADGKRTGIEIIRKGSTCDVVETELAE